MLGRPEFCAWRSRCILRVAPEKSRLPELTSVTVPTLVVQGDHDPFGVPDPQTLQSGVTLVVVSGDHSLKKEAPAIRAAISTWVAELIRGA